MLFNFLKYLSPVWYFNLKPQTDHRYFPTQEDLEKEGILLKYDPLYISEEAQKRDLAYRAFQMGFISKINDKHSSEDFWERSTLPLFDEYRFIRKNFSKVWVLYVLIVRLLSMNNPFKEMAGFWKSRNAKREQYHLNPVTYSTYQDFESSLLREKPLVSVIIPTLNRYPYLKDVFRDLEKQSYQNFEVIVVDQSEPFDPKVYEGWNLDLRFWYQEEKALWKARNSALNLSKGEIIVFSEDDVRINFNWLEEHLKCLDFFNADISAGVFFPDGTQIPESKNYFKWAEQFATGNSCVKKEVFQKTGLFDLRFEKQRMGDGEFGLRCYLNGFRSISNPYAFCIDIKAPTGGLRQMGSWDAFRPKKFWSERPIPSVLYYSRKYFGNNSAFLMLLKNIPPSIVPYKWKRNKLFLALGSILTILISPIIVFQVILSWNRASKMLD